MEIGGRGRQWDRGMTCPHIICGHTEVGCGGIHHLPLQGMNFLLKKLKYFEMFEIPLRSGYTAPQ
jgi:hypothetical protein